MIVGWQRLRGLLPIAPRRAPRRFLVRHVRALVVAAIALLVASCAAATPSPTPAYWPTESWRTSTPEQQGMDSEMLAAVLGTIQEQDRGIDSVSVVRNGYLVLEAAVYPYRPDARHVIRSCSKSIVSALIGIAIDKGYIESVKQPVLGFFPGRTVANLDARKEAMTLEHLLTMTSGLECRDSYLYRWLGLDQMRQSDD